MGKGACFKGAKLKRKLGLVSFPLAALATVQVARHTLFWECTEGQVAFLHSLPSPWLCVRARKHFDPCPSLSTVVSPSLGAGEDAVPAFCSSLLRGDELPQECRLPPGDGHLQSFSLEWAKMVLSLLWALFWETQKTFTTLLWRGRISYRNT